MVFNTNLKRLYNSLSVLKMISKHIEKVFIVISLHESKKQY